MRAQSTGSAALLMFVFLGVIAVVGVFGIPQFAPVVASPSLRADGWTSDEFSPLQDVNIDGAFMQGVEDLFAPIDHKPLERQAQAGGQAADSRDASTELPGEALDGWTLRSQHGGSSFAEWGRKRIIQPDRHRSSATLDDRPPAHLRLLAFGEPSAPPEAADRITRSGGVVPQAANRQQPEPLTWRTAVVRLNSLGIRNFRLSPGERPREFHFSCFFTPADNPRITHRFEAEASEPLEAVKKVLAQIDDWLADR